MSLRRQVPCRDVETIEEEKEEVGRFTDVMLHSYHQKHALSSATYTRSLPKDTMPPLNFYGVSNLSTFINLWIIALSIHIHRQLLLPSIGQCRKWVALWYV